jgi:succinoglycan biosynthesis transport protein ExoP
MNFQQLFLILWARRWAVIGAPAVAVAVTVTVSLLLPKTYTASTSLVLEAKGVDPVTGQPVLAAQLMPSYIATQSDIIQSHNVAAKVVDALKLADIPAVREQFQQATEGRGTIRDWMADRLLKALDVEPSKTSNIIDVSYKGADPEFAAHLANAFAQAYMETNLELRVDPARQTASFFNDQLKTLADNLEKARAKLSAYQREHGIVSVEEPGDVETQRLSNLSVQLVATQSQAIDAQTRLRQLNEVLHNGKSADTVSDVLNNPLIQSLKADLARAESKLAELSEKVGPNHPDYQRVVAEIAATKSKIDAEIRTVSASVANSARAAEQREAELRAAVAAQRGKVLGSTEKRDQLTLLTREVENAQRMYDMAANRFGQTRLESQTSQTDIAVLNPAVPPLAPSGPKTMRNALLATFLGTLLGVGVGFLLELVDRRVRSGEDLSQLIGIPLLATILPEPSRGRWSWRWMQLFRLRSA